MNITEIREGHYAVYCPSQNIKERIYIFRIMRDGTVLIKRPNGTPDRISPEKITKIFES